MLLKMSFADSSGAAKAIQDVTKLTTEIAKILFDAQSAANDATLLAVFRKFLSAVGTARSHGIDERDIHLIVAAAIRDTAPPRELDDPSLA
jgi:hypothetical protein